MLFNTKSRLGFLVLSRMLSEIFIVSAASAVEGQVKEKSRLCHFVNELSEKFKVFC